MISISIFDVVFFLMIRRPPRSTRTYTLFPYTPLFRSLAEREDGFDLILSDVLMPELTGPEMVAQLKQRWPELSVLFVTGYAGDASEDAAFGDHDVLRKPFTLSARDRALRRSGETRSEERRVGNECVRTCRFRWSQYHQKKK